MVSLQTTPSSVPREVERPERLDPVVVHMGWAVKNLSLTFQGVTGRSKACIPQGTLFAVWEKEVQQLLNSWCIMGYIVVIYPGSQRLFYQKNVLTR